LTRKHRPGAPVPDIAGRVWIRLLGPFEMQVGAGAPPRLPKKAQALLAFLALARGRTVPRDQLATLLWGDSGTEQARQSLRQALVSLRNAFEHHGDDLLVADTVSVRLAPDRAAIDADEFEAAARSEPLHDLERANALYRDELLAGLHIPVEPFSRWVTIERQRFLSLRLDLLQRLALAQAEARRLDDAVGSARQLVVLDPLREEAHRLLIRLLAENGNRSAALLQYDRCIDILREELGVDPEPETIEIAEAVRTGAPAPRPAVRAREGDDETLMATADRASPAATNLPLPDKPSIVVLPFANLSGDPGQDYFIHGLVDDMTVALGREKWLFVIASPSASTFRSSAADPREIGAKLGVRYVVRGSVRIDGDRVLLVAQLNDASRGAHVFSGRFEDEMDNLFALQERLTTKVAAAIAPALMLEEVARARHKPTDSLSAFDLYLRALPLFRTSAADNSEALRLLRQAIELDPSYAAALGLAARCFQFRAMFGWTPPGDPSLREGIAFGHRAAEKGRNDSEALWMAGLALVHLSGEIEYSLALIERSLSLNPNSANAWIASCFVRSYLGDSAAAIEDFQTAQRLNPLDLSQHLHWNALGWAHLAAGRYEEAAEAAERTLRAQPSYLAGLRLKVSACGLLGRIDEGRATLRQALAIQPTLSIAWMRDFLKLPLQRKPQILDTYLKGLRLAGVPEGPVESE
jgi:DNA-binding SARP family transcriptional activator/Tfp pilus assembly protein PilF